MAVGLRVPRGLGDGDLDQSANRSGRAQRETLFKWIKQAKSGGGWIERRGFAWRSGLVGIHRRGSVFFQCTDYAGGTAKLEERIRRYGWVGHAVYERR